MISNRIKNIASLIDKNNRGVYDVGSDHGYLLLLLKDLYGDKILLKGVENKEGPFNNLKNNVKNKNIEYQLSDGINDLTSSFSCVVLAGMGYDNIKKIIDKHLEKLEFIDQIVIDSHTKLKECREYFISLNFYIENEIIIKEDDIFYEIISFKKGKRNYSDLEIEYGPFLIKEKNKFFKEKYELENKKINEILLKIDKNSSKYNDLLSKLERNKEVLKNEF